MTAKIGDRVMLVRCNDKWTQIKSGTCGTVSFIDSNGTVFVDWDDGSRLGMVADAGDSFVLIGPHMTCGHESRGHSSCLLPKGHTGDPDEERRLHSDLTLLWNDDGRICNLDGQPI
jgi:hypothetical protein